MSDHVERNWSQNLTYSHAALLRPRTVEELQEIVAVATKVKALGTRHSFTDAADTPGGALVSLADLDEQLADVRRALTRQRDELSDLGPPAPDEVSVADDWKALVDWSKEQATALLSQAKALTAEAKDATTRLAAGEKAVEDLLGYFRKAIFLDEGQNTGFYRGQNSGKLENHAF